MLTITEYEQQLFDLIRMDNLILYSSRLKDGTRVAVVVATYEDKDYVLPIGILVNDELFKRTKHPNVLEYQEEVITAPFETNNPNLVTLKTTLDGQPINLLAFQTISEYIQTAPILYVMNQWLFDNLLSPKELLEDLEGKAA